MVKMGVLRSANYAKEKHLTLIIVCAMFLLMFAILILYCCIIRRRKEYKKIVQSIAMNNIVVVRKILSFMNVKEMKNLRLVNSFWDKAVRTQFQYLVKSIRIDYYDGIFDSDRQKLYGW